LKLKPQLLKRLQRVIVVDGATHTQKDDVERIRNGGLCAVPIQRSAGSAV
jgi:hypothetical protein